jgi:uncharacterized protein YqeY
MSLTDKINNGIKEAMKAKQTERLNALRAIKSEILLAQTSSGAPSEITPEVEIKIIQKLVKQRKDSAEIFKNSGRNDLYENEIGELKFIEEYLPAQLSDSELTVIVKRIIEQTGANSIKEMGKVIGLANKEVAGRAEGKTISEKVKELLG